jgi:hypothetical protein
MKRPLTDEEKKRELDAALAAMKPKPAATPSKEATVWTEADGTVVVRITGEGVSA